MLYDEDGRAFVEPPILPEDINVFWIVKDYRRIYDMRNKMETKIYNLGKKNTQMAQYNFFMRHKLQELLKVTNKLTKHIKNQGQKISKKDIDVIYDATCVAYPAMKKEKY